MLHASTLPTVAPRTPTDAAACLLVMIMIGLAAIHLRQEMLHIAGWYSRQRTRDRSSHQFVLCNSVLQYVDVVNDLGAMVDQHLTFSEHVDQIVKKAVS